MYKLFMSLFTRHVCYWIDLYEDRLIQSLPQHRFIIDVRCFWSRNFFETFNCQLIRELSLFLSFFSVAFSHHLLPWLSVLFIKWEKVDVAQDPATSFFILFHSPSLVPSRPLFTSLSVTWRSAWDLVRDCIECGSWYGWRHEGITRLVRLCIIVKLMTAIPLGKREPSVLASLGLEDRIDRRDRYGRSSGHTMRNFLPRPESRSFVCSGEIDPLHFIIFIFFIISSTPPPPPPLHFALFLHFVRCILPALGIDDDDKWSRIMDSASKSYG